MRPIDRITTDPDHMDGQPCVRNLPIKFWKVYLDLAFHGLPEGEILRKYPGLEPEDLAAVREYAVHLIKSRTHDEFTGRPLLPRDQLRHGVYYKGRCRNASVARWNAEEGQFYHWREKFGRAYVQTIRYPTDETEAWWDVFDVVEELREPKFEIPFDLEAVFTGNAEDLAEFSQAMWSKP